jgi:hypothetical protein
VVPGNPIDSGSDRKLVLNTIFPIGQANWQRLRGTTKYFTVGDIKRKPTQNIPDQDEPTLIKNKPDYWKIT